MKEIFTTKIDLRVRSNDIAVKSHDTATYGDKSLTLLGPKIWSSLPENRKPESSFSRVKESVDT